MFCEQLNYYCYYPTVYIFLLHLYEYDDSSEVTDE